MEIMPIRKGPEKEEGMGFGSKEKDGFYGWISVSATALLSFVCLGGVTYSFGAFQPSICKAFNWSVRDVSLALTLVMLFMSLAAPMAGFFVGKYGARRSLVLGSVMGVLGLVLLAYHQKLWQLYIGYGLFIGIGVAAFAGIIPQTTIANNWFRKRVSLAMGIIVGLGGIGGIVLVPIIMAFIERFGWRNAYLILAGMALVFAVIIPAVLIKNKPEDLGQVPDGAVASQDEPRETGPKFSQYVTPVDFTVKEALRTPTLWFIIISITMVFFLLTVTMAHQIAFLESIGVSAGVAAFSLGLIPGVSALANLLMGFMTIKFSLKKLSVVSSALMLVGMIILFFTKSAPMALTYSIIFGFGYGAAMVAGMSLSSSYFGRTDYPKIMGISMVFSILGSVGAPIAGAIYDSTKSYSTAFVLTVIAALIGLVSMIMVRPPLHPSLRDRGKN